MIYAFIKPFAPYLAGAAIIAVVWFGGRWQAVQSIKHDYAAREATNKESQRLAEKAALNAKENYETSIETHKRSSASYRGADRLRQSKPVAENAPAPASDNPSSPARTPRAPQLEWLN